MAATGGDDGGMGLRRQAEELLRARGGGASAAGPATALADAQKLVHELQVHQVELEMQNEELRRVQADLGAARARYFDLYDLAPMGYLSLDAGGLIVEANLMAAELLGLPRGALVGQPLERFIAKSEQDHYYLQRRRPHPARTGQAIELMMRKSDGAYFWARLVEGPAQGEAGGARRVVLSDISERKRNEADRERLLAAVEQADEAIVITDPAGAIQYVNPAFTRVTGYARAEAVGQNPRLLKSGAQGPAFYRGLWAALTAGQAWTGRFDNRRKDGGRYIQECTITPVLDLDENIINYVSVARDITQRLAQEAAALQSQKMETVGRLAGGVAHDFNNMLGVILGFAELELAVCDPAAPLHASLEEIAKAALRSAELTKQLLAFARRQAVTPVAVGLNQSVAGLLKMLPRLLGESVRLRWEPQAGLWPVKADPAQVEQVLINLCVNARDAMGGSGELRLATANASLGPVDCEGHAGAVPGDYVVLSVADDGAGMDAATLRQIFEPFFTTKPMGKGTGLGLSMVYGVVSEARGFVSVDSIPGGGTRFKVHLPRLVGLAAPATGTAAVPSIEAGKMLVLLVEDEPSFLKLGARLLGAQGFQVLSAQSPAEALALAAELGPRIQLLVTDMVMPGMDGRELARRVIALAPGCACLFMSGYAPGAGLSDGDLVTPLLSKPFSVPELLAKVTEALAAPRLGAGPSP